MNAQKTEAFKKRTKSRHSRKVSNISNIAADDKITISLAAYEEMKAELKILRQS
jgi:hypothetical protein